MGSLVWFGLVVLHGLCQAVQEEQLSCGRAQVSHNSSLSSFCNSAPVSFDECCRLCKLSQSCVSFEVSDRCYLSRKSATKEGSGTVYVLTEKLSVTNKVIEEEEKTTLGGLGTAHGGPDVQDATAAPSVDNDEPVDTEGKTHAPNDDSPLITTDDPEAPRPGCVVGEPAMYSTPFIYQRMRILPGPDCDASCIRDPKCLVNEATPDGTCYLLSPETTINPIGWSSRGNAKIKLTNCPESSPNYPELSMLNKYMTATSNAWGVKLAKGKFSHPICLAKTRSDSCKNVFQVCANRNGQRLWKFANADQIALGQWCSNTYGDCGATQAIYEFWHAGYKTYLYHTRNNIANPTANGYVETRLFCYGWPGGNCALEK